MKHKKTILWLVVGALLASGGVAFSSVQAEPVKQEEVVHNFPKAIASSKKAVKKWTHADADVIQQMNLFLQSVQKGVKEGVLSEVGAEEILKAVRYTAKKHQTQTRANAKKTPYLIHLLAVADQVMRIGQCYEESVIIAALLHDSIENTDITYEEIEKVFGLKVASYVKELTEDPKLPLKERKKLQIVHAFHQSKEVALVKMSDKLHNLNTLMTDPPEGWTEKRIDDYFLWAQAVVDNLPASNNPLKEELHKTIEKYWEHR